MREEIDAAMVFLKRLIEKCESLPTTKVEEFTACLSAVLADRFRDHWYKEKPTRGQGYRCISFSPKEPADPVLEKAASVSGICLEEPLLPIEMTLWVDPNEVCCRIGDIRTNYCTVASMKDGSLDNKAHTLDVTDLIQRAKEMYFKQLNITTTRVNSNRRGHSIDKLRTWHQPSSSKPLSQTDNQVHNNNRNNNYFQSSPPSSSSDVKTNSENNDHNDTKFNQNIVTKQQNLPPPPQHPQEMFNAFGHRQPFGQLDNGQPFVPPDFSVPPPPMNFKPWQAPGAYSPPAKNKNLNAAPAVGFRNHGNKNFNFKQAPPPPPPPPHLKANNDRFHWQKEARNKIGS